MIDAGIEVQDKILIAHIFQSCLVCCLTLFEQNQNMKPLEKKISLEMRLAVKATTADKNIKCIHLVNNRCLLSECLILQPSETKHLGEGLSSLFKL